MTECPVCLGEPGNPALPCTCPADDPIRARLDRPNHVSGVSRPMAIAALRAVLDIECEAPYCHGQGYHLALRTVRRVIAEHLGVTDA